MLHNTCKLKFYETVYVINILQNFWYIGNKLIKIRNNDTFIKTNRTKLNIIAVLPIRGNVLHDYLEISIIRMRNDIYPINKWDTLESKDLFLHSLFLDLFY